MRKQTGFWRLLTRPKTTSALTKLWKLTEIALLRRFGAGRGVPLLLSSNITAAGMDFFSPPPPTGPAGTDGFARARTVILFDTQGWRSFKRRNTRHRGSHWPTSCNFVAHSALRSQCFGKFYPGIETRKNACSPYIQTRSEALSCRPPGRARSSRRRDEVENGRL